MLNKVYEEEDVKVAIIPDIESVNYGRGVGYEVNEHVPPQNISRISATSIREKINKGNDDWKEIVDPKIHDLVIKYLGE